MIDQCVEQSTFESNVIPFQRSWKCEPIKRPKEARPVRGTCESKDVSRAEG